METKEPKGKGEKDIKGDKSEADKVVTTKKKKATLIVLGALFLTILAALFFFQGKKEGITYVSISLDVPQATPLIEGAKPFPLILSFNHSSARLEDVDKDVSEGISIKPQINGKWRWEGDDELVFQPSDDWPAGEEYTVELDKALFPDHIRLKKSKLTFSTEEFSVSIENTEFYQDPIEVQNKKVVATIMFSHPVKAETLEKRVKLFIYDSKKGEKKGRDKDYGFTLTYDKFMGKAYIHSDRVSIPLDDAYMKIVIEEGVKPVLGDSELEEDLEDKVWVPGMYNFFKFSSVEPSLVRNEFYEPEQVLAIEATNGVSPDMLRENLSIFLLPKDRPPTRIDNKVRKNYGWPSPSEITKDILSISERLDPEAMEAALDYPTLHSFRLDVPQRRYIYVKIEKGLKSFGGYILANTYEGILRMPDYPKEIKIMHDGALLSMSGNKTLSVLSRGIKGISFEVARVLPAEVNHLVSQTKGNFKDPYFSNRSFSQDNISEVFEETKPLKDIGPKKAQYSSFDFSKYMKDGKKGLFFFKVDSWDPKRKRRTGHSDKRLILVTDLGMVVKENVDRSKDIFVQSINSGMPVRNAKVEVLGKNGIPIVTVWTDEDGHANLPELKSFRREKKPTVYTVRKENDISFMAFDRRDRGLNLSRFETGGVYSEGKSDRLNAYLFSDRGLYRPGDIVNVGLIVKHPDWKKSLKGMPMELTVVDVKGQEIKKEKITLSATALEEFSFKTEEYSPTGSYTVNAYIVKDERRGSLLGSTTVRIEEFLPDRMKISTRFSKTITEGWVSPEDLKGYVSLRNLFGTAAADRRVSATIEIKSVHPYFRGYKDYVFYDPAKRDKSFFEQLEEKKSDENGEAEFDFDLKRFDKSTFNLKFIVEGFESGGGRSVSSHSNILVSPLNYIIGHKKDGDLGYINKGSQRSVNFIAINSKLKAVSVGDISAVIVEERYTSVLTKQKNGVYKYQSVMKEIPYHKEAINISEKGLSFSLPTDEPGDYALKVIDENGTELNKVRFSVVGHGNLMGKLEKNAELQIKLNKQDFNNGEAIEVFIKAPYNGSGLITIEKDKVYSYKWFKASTNSTLESIVVPEDLEGNGYVNVTFVRGMDSKEIFMSPLSYAVQPFFVSKEKKNIGIDITVPTLVKPGKELKVAYKGKKNGKAVIFAIDEGILQVANYKTPDPLSHYFKKRALEVDTRQILDLILPEITMDKLFAAPGGGMYEDEAIGRNLNPFKRKRLKPVVFWSGIVDVGPSTREVTYNVPDYFNGTLRVMAVAVTSDAIGSAESKTLVRGDFVLSPNVPTFVSPGDQFDVTLSLTNSVEGSGESPEIALSLETSSHFDMISEKLQKMVVAEQREGTATFKLRAADLLGSGKLKFIASYGSKRASYTVHISVRPPTPYMSYVQTGYAKKLPNVAVKRKMFEAFSKREASVSPLPLSLSGGLLNYLAKFPYGCTEQLTSKGFPAIALKGKPEFGYSDGNIVKTYVNRTIDLIRGRQNPNGGFRYWPSGGNANDFISVYVAHFLTEAKDKGIAVPGDMLGGVLLYLKDSLREKATSLDDARVQAYTIYVLTRNGEITTNYISALTDYLDKNHRDSWKDDLISAHLAATYKLLQKDDVAEKLIRHYKIGKERVKRYEYFYDTLISDARYLDLVSRHFPNVADKIGGEEILVLVDKIVQRQYNSISSAYTILGLSSYAEVASRADVTGIGIYEILEDGKRREIKSSNGLFVKGNFSDGAKEISFEGKSQYTLFYQVVESGFDVGLPADIIKKGMEVQREFRNESGEVVNKANLGEELSVHLKIRSVNDTYQSNLAIVDLLPGGFEVVLDSVRGNAEGSTFGADYIDVREDRVIVFGSADQSVKEFVYRIKATNSGQYKVPPAFGESMYDKSVQARSTGAQISVDAR